MQNTPENVFGQNTVANPQKKTASSNNSWESDTKELWISPQAKSTRDSDVLLYLCNFFYLCSFCFIF